MTLFPETRPSLLLQVQDPQNAEAWEQFALIYRPVIYRLARQRGLQDADAQDLTQHVMMTVSSAVRKWEDRGNGTRFRHWLRRVARHAIINAISRRPRDAAIGGTTVQNLMREAASEDGDVTQRFELEYRRELYLRAAAAVREDVQPETWRAFELSVVEGRSVDETARVIGKSVGTVYAARSRVMRRLQEAVERFEEHWTRRG